MRFDLSTYKARTARLCWDDLDLSCFGSDPLDEADLRCLRYMHDVEFHTVCYLRDLLLTPAHRDPEVTAFLSFWVYEEFWHGEALAAVLGAHGEASGPDRVGPMRDRLGRADRFRPALMTIGATLAGADFTAVHMAWGAVNEWTTQAGYAQLSRRAAHPVLAGLLARIMRQEGRHIDFYAAQAEGRLGTSPRARRLARLALGRFWHPVGAGVMPASESRHLAYHLFGDAVGLDAARRVDRHVDRLPGLGGLGLLEGAVRGWGPEQPEARVPAPAPLGRRMVRHGRLASAGAGR